jgi:hypothetical protein
MHFYMHSYLHKILFLQKVGVTVFVLLVHASKGPTYFRSRFFNLIGLLVGQ